MLPALLVVGLAMLTMLRGLSGEGQPATKGTKGPKFRGSVKSRSESMGTETVDAKSNVTLDAESNVNLEAESSPAKAKLVMACGQG